MSDLLVSLILAAGAAVFIYSTLGRRLGYSNGQTVWAIMGVGFIIAFIVVFTFLKLVLHVS